MDVKNVFYVYYSCYVFNVFNVFYFVNVFYLKNVHWKFHKEVREHFWNWNYRNELIGLDFIMKVAGRRAALYPLRTEHRPITWGSAYSDTAVMTSCSRRIQYVKWIATN